MKSTTNAAHRIHGLYAIAPEIDDTLALLLKVKAALEGGARMVQYRNKQSPANKRIEHAIALAALCQKHSATFIINDDLKLAWEVEADGVHLGKTDGDIATARKKLGPNKLIGASCYDQLDLAHAAIGAGADYLAFGSVFASSTKPHAARAPLALFAAAKQFKVPLVAIGGITVANAPEVIVAGADATAVIASLFDAPDIRARATEFTALFPR